MKIRGEYYFIINDGEEKTRTKTYHNLITDNGLEFFIKRIFTEELKIKNICFGKGTSTPSTSDESLDFETGATEDLKFKTENNELIIIAETIGEIVNETTEIGVSFVDENNNTYLISRDVHEELDVPSNAVITTKYSYIITQENEV